MRAGRDEERITSFGDDAIEAGRNTAVLPRIRGRNTHPVARRKAQSLGTLRHAMATSGEWCDDVYSKTLLPQQLRGDNHDGPTPN